jgi:flagellar motor switch protein FliM
MSNLQVPLQNLTELVPGNLLAFTKSVSAPAVMLVGDVRLCSAAPVRVGARRAARVLSLETPFPAAGEL